MSSFTEAFGSSALRYYLGAVGDPQTGAGGASTLAAIGGVSSSAEAPCVVADSDGIEPKGEKIEIKGFHSGSREACDRQNVVPLAGGGGGSFAYRGDAPPSENVPKIGAPGKSGAIVIVIEGVG